VNIVDGFKEWETVLFLSSIRIRSFQVSELNIENNFHLSFSLSLSLSLSFSLSN
jgi:hypothetical protein